MALTLNAFTLPPGLTWSDEFVWTPVALSTIHSVTGALLIQTSTKLAGRPITLVGKSDGNAHTGGLRRSDLLTLQTALAVTGATFTLTLHDGRTFTVIAAENPLDAEPIPVVGSHPPADPASTRWYLLRSLKLLTV